MKYVHTRIHTYTSTTQHTHTIQEYKSQEDGLQVLKPTTYGDSDTPLSVLNTGVCIPLSATGSFIDPESSIDHESSIDPESSKDPESSIEGAPLGLEHTLFCRESKLTPDTHVCILTYYLCVRMHLLCMKKCWLGA